MLGKEEIGWQLEECITAAEGAGREQQASRISLMGANKNPKNL